MSYRALRHVSRYFLESQRPQLLRAWHNRGEPETEVEPGWSEVGTLATHVPHADKLLSPHARKGRRTRVTRRLLQDGPAIALF